VIAILTVIAKQEPIAGSVAVARLRRKAWRTGWAERRWEFRLERIRELHAEELSLRAIGKQLRGSPMTMPRALGQENAA
jgi:hypothetical protein